MGVCLSLCVYVCVCVGVAEWRQGLWTVIFNYKDDSLKEDLGVIKREVLDFLSLQNIFLGKLLNGEVGVGEEPLQL